MNEEIDTYKNSKILKSGSRPTISRSQTIDRLPRLSMDAVGWDGVLKQTAQVERGGSMSLHKPIAFSRLKVLLAPNSRDVPRLRMFDKVSRSLLVECIERLPEKHGLLVVMDAQGFATIHCFSSRVREESVCISRLSVYIPAFGVYILKQGGAVIASLIPRTRLGMQPCHIKSDGGVSDVIVDD